MYKKFDCPICQRPHSEDKIPNSCIRKANISHTNLCRVTKYHKLNCEKLALTIASGKEI